MRRAAIGCLTCDLAGVGDAKECKRCAPSIHEPKQKPLDHHRTSTRNSRPAYEGCAGPWRNH
eukprot:2226901-Rhodomonas_salina.2